MTNEDRAVSTEVADAAADDIRGLMRTTRERVSEVLLTAERAATDVVEAANADAERIVRETHASAKKLAGERMAKVESVVDSVARKVQTLDTEIDALRELIDRSIIELGKELGLEGEASDADPESDAADEPDAPKPVDEAEEKDRDHSEAVRLLASQLIATGHSPKEAEERLVEEFGVSDPKPALEAIGYKHKRFRRNAYVRAGD